MGLCLFSLPQTAFLLGESLFTPDLIYEKPVPPWVLSAGCHCQAGRSWRRELPRAPGHGGGAARTMAGVGLLARAGLGGPVPPRGRGAAWPRHSLSRRAQYQARAQRPGDGRKLRPQTPQASLVIGVFFASAFLGCGFFFSNAATERTGNKYACAGRHSGTLFFPYGLLGRN